MKLTLPEGFQMPANAREGEPFEVVATITPSEGGFMLSAIDGMKLPEEEEPETEEMEMEEPEMADPEIKIPFEA